MYTEKSIIRIDYDDQRSKAALAAEEKLFAHYGLNYRAHLVEMGEPDLRIRVLEVGSGRPVLMVPGGAGDAWPLAPIMAELTGWRMIAINRPGGGLSDGIDHRQVDLRRLAVDTIRTVSGAFDLEVAPIVCNSMGGLWSAWYALDEPRRVTRMVQMGCPALALDTSAPMFMRLIGVPGLGQFLAPLLQPKEIDGALEMLKTQGSSPEEIGQLPRAAAEAAYHFYQLPTYQHTWKTLISAVTTVSGARPRYQLTSEQLRHIQQPVQFIWGDRDVFGGLETARRCASAVPNARLYEVSTGHLPFLDDPEQTGKVIRAFMAEEKTEKTAELATVP